MARRGPKPAIRTTANFNNDGPSARLDQPVTFEQMRSIIERAERRQLTEFEVARLRHGLNKIEDGERLIRELTTENSRLNNRVRVLVGLFRELQSLADFWDERIDRTEVSMTIMGIRRYVSLAFKHKDGE